MMDTIVVRVGRERVALKRAQIRWNGTHRSGTVIRVEAHSPFGRDGHIWTAEVGGYRKSGSTPQRAVTAALVLYRDKVEAKRTSALEAIERCEKALAQARANAPRRAQEYADLLEALR